MHLYAHQKIETPQDGSKPAKEQAGPQTVDSVFQVGAVMAAWRLRI